MSDEYTVNVSSIYDFMSCRFRWVCKWVENRVPAEDADALRFGKLLHKVFENILLQRGSAEDVLSRYRGLWLEKRDAAVGTPAWGAANDALDDLDQMWEPMLLWQDKYRFDVPALEIEEPFVLPHPKDHSIILKGRPDRVALLGNTLYHVQNRSLGAAVNFPLYIMLQKRNYHEHLYGEAIFQKYGSAETKYGGTFYNLYRKLKYRKKQTKAQEKSGEPGTILHPVSEIFWQHPMTVDLDSPLHEHVMDCILGYARQMRDVEEHYRLFGEAPLPNEKLNGGMHGNRVDEYYRVLTGEISLSDDTYFKDREDTYAPATEE